MKEVDFSSYLDSVSYPCSFDFSFGWKVKNQKPKKRSTPREVSGRFSIFFSVSDSPKILLPQFKNSRNHTIMTSFVRYLSYFLNSRTWTIRRYSNTILYILKYVLNWYFVFRFIYFLRARKIAKNGPSRAKMDIHIGYLHDIKHLNVSLDT